MFSQRRQQREEAAIRRFASAKRLYKIYPPISVMNPFLLKIMRQSLKRKYISLFKRKVALLRKRIMVSSSSDESAQDSSESDSKKESSSSTSNEEESI